MQQPYKIPLHHCQWCYKATARFIIDCLCVACQSCFTQKNSWLHQNRTCYYCQKPTQRKFIDLKVNPQQGGIYFQNINLSMKNMIKVQEFQSQVSKKYCKHLQKKVSKLQTVIKTFIKQFPQHQSFFQSMMTQMQQKENKNFRSKSVNQTDSQSSLNFEKMLYHNKTERNIHQHKPQIHQKNAQIRSNSKTAYFKPQNKMKNYPPSQKSSVASRQFHDYQQKRNKNLYPIQGKKTTESLHGSNFQNSSLKFGNQYKIKNQSQQQYDQTQSMKSYQKSNVMNLSKNEMPIQVYQVGGNNKFSDPTKQQMNITNINMQTALRSIRSEDGRDNFLPFYQNYQMDSRRKNRKNQLIFNPNIESPNNNRNHNGDAFVFHHKKGPK